LVDPSWLDANAGRAFGQQDGPSEDPFLIALATLTMLSQAADTEPVLCIVDDAHWLDAASAAALLFMARRLQADPVAVLFAARDGEVRTFAAHDLPTLVLGGLSGTAARQLLDERIGAPVPEAVAVQALERELGAALYLRGTRPVRLTAAGEALVGAARRTLASAAQAEEAVHRTRDALIGTLRLGISLSARHLVPFASYFGEFTREHPGIDLRLQYASASTMIAMLGPESWIA